MSLPVEVDFGAERGSGRVRLAVARESGRVRLAVARELASYARGCAGVGELGSRWRVSWRVRLAVARERAS